VAYIWGNIELPGGSKLGDNSCDVVIVSNVLFQAPDKRSLLMEARRVLRPNGKILLIDWTASFNNMGPTQDQIVSEAEAKKLAESCRMDVKRTIDAGNYHYGLILEKSSTLQAQTAAVL
jgi:ubiquinone/menaquinone biosynthesis C-methylase UbiE